MRVLVCGGRNFGDMPKWVTFGTPEYNRAAQRVANERRLLAETLEALEPSPSVIIHGAARGADSNAQRWARRTGIPDLSFKADWYPNGFGRLDKSAGPRRNQQMLDEGKPDLVVAFPGGTGTADMVRRARNAGVRVIEAAKTEVAL